MFECEGNQNKYKINLNEEEFKVSNYQKTTVLQNMTNSQKLFTKEKIMQKGYNKEKSCYGTWHLKR